MQSGGKRATIRSWKTYYTVVCGQLLCFFKDKEGFVDNNAAAPPVSLLQAKCSKAADYTKKKHVFRLQLGDGAEFLFMAHDEKTMQDWMNKIAFHAALPPSMQLMSYDTHRSGNTGSFVPTGSEGSSASTPRITHGSQETLSGTSSQNSTPEQRRVVSSHPSPVRPDQGISTPPSYTDTVHLREKPKPPVPPRSINSRPTSDPSRTMPDTSVSVRSRIEMFQSQQQSVPPPVAPRSSYPLGNRPFFFFF